MQNKPNAVTLLSRKVVNGSEVTTGTEKMPAHPDLANGKAAEIIHWILKNGADPHVEYLRGLEGAFRTKEKPEKNKGKAAYILVASYMDHGLPKTPNAGKEGKYTLVLRSN